MIWITEDTKVTTSSRITTRDFSTQSSLKVKFRVTVTSARMLRQNSLRKGNAVPKQGMTRT
jgi:hypothetical protein